MRRAEPLRPEAPAAGELLPLSAAAGDSVSDTRGAPLHGGAASCPSPANALQAGRRWLYERSPLLRSSAFRMAMSFWVLLILCTGGAGLFFYERLQQTAMGKIDATIQDRVLFVQSLYAAQGFEGVAQIARDRETSPMQSELGFHMSTPDGSLVLGNMPEPIDAQGWSTLEGGEIGLDNAQQYRFYSTTVDGNSLTVGMGLQTLADLRAVALNCLLWAFGLSMALALLAAWYLRHRSGQRMQGFEEALHRVADGNLSARMPVTSAGDDIDLMAVTMNAALDRLNNSVDTMRQVSTDIAHDLKTPLNRLYIHLDEAAGRSAELAPDEGAPIVDALESALAEAEHINSTFEALLRVAQIEAGSRRANFKHFDLAEALGTVCEIYAPVVEESCAGLEVRFDAGKPLPMYGDRELVLQLIVNLIENAIRHGCQNGRPDITIAVEAGRNDEVGQVWLAVIDDGPGIPPDMRDKVFQRLFRLERSRTTGGTGLGLSLVKAIADLHCGLIELADNEPGLRFNVTFDFDCPLAKARALTSH